MKTNTTALSGCLVILLGLIISAAIGAICWPYTINTWLHFTGKEETLKWWQGSLLGFCPILGQLSMPAAIVTWILMLFLA